MADSELYREEIVIDVQDGTAVSNVNKFEQKFKQSINRMDKMAQGLGNKKIEPMIQVRDKLTASAVKADRLIKKLDAAHASPVIAAQDRVTNVVTRVNAMIDAINRKDAKVVAEMKGPLADELVRAKKAVADLGDAKAGPVADLKGELFSQLSRAQSMMRNVDRMTVRPKVRIWDMATSSIRYIDRGLRSLSSKAWSITVRVAGGALNTVKNMLGSVGRLITSPLAMLGVGAGAAGAIAGGIVKPLGLAGDMEQTRIAFDTMLGSAEKAQSFLKEMQDFAAKTPFEFPELQENAKLMLAFGFSTKRIMPMLETVGDTAAGLGAGSEGIQRMTRALGQMQAKGRVQTEELMQLQELGVPVNEILQEELGLTSEQIANIGKEGVASGKVIDAVLRGMDKRFGGLMDKQSRSLKGLWSTIKDTFNMNVLLKWGDGIRRAVEPRLQSLVDWFGKNEKKIEEWGNKLEKIAGEASEWVLKKLESTFKWLDTNFFSNEDFMKLDFKGKVTFVWDTIKGEFDSWYETNGKGLITEWGGKLGSGLGSAMGAALMTFAGVQKVDTGEMLHTPMSNPEVNTNPFVEAGTTAAESFIKGFTDNFDFGAILKELINKNLQVVKEPSWENFAGAVIRDTIIGVILNKLGVFKFFGWIFKHVPKKAAANVGKSIATAGKSATAGGTAAAGGAAAGLGGLFKNYTAAYQLARGTGAGPISSIFKSFGIMKETAPAAAAGFNVSNLLKGLDIPMLALGLSELVSRYTEHRLSTKTPQTMGFLDKALSWITGITQQNAAEKAAARELPDKGASIGEQRLEYRQQFEQWASLMGYGKGRTPSGKFIWNPWSSEFDVAQARNLGNWSEDIVKQFESQAGIKWPVVDAVKDYSKQAQVAKADTDKMNNQMQRLYGVSTELAGGYGKVGESATVSSDLAKSGMDSMASAVNDTMNNVVNIADITAARLTDPSFAAGYNLGSGVTSGVYAAYSQSSPIVRWILNTIAGGRNITAKVAEISRMNIQTSRLYGIPGHATGAITTKPHLAMVSEEGPEAIIPLSRARRNRGLKLWQETGRHLGVEGYAEGGYTSVPVAATTNQSGSVVNIYMNGLIGTVSVNGIGDIQKVASMAADAVAQQLTEVLENKAS
ncbi:tape measure protein [Mahella australiensis]|uniref:Phage tape measure protein n=1 Tax=Mahella australiensis (strain DSM 15567 / CIP 107919 / 50-1 BON) TaxID=697281 RepID=F3ZZX0_MAHA5|nr:tape measure protein [Mahella australiensis]AEE95788.1 phage tape measure protein [Mahella australiensis 50-1 BON]